MHKNPCCPPSWTIIENQLVMYVFNPGKCQHSEIKGGKGSRKFGYGQIFCMWENVINVNKCGEWLLPKPGGLIRHIKWLQLHSIFCCIYQISNKDNNN